MAATSSGFALLDWLVLSGYLALVMGIGLAASRRKPSGNEIFLAGRGMPVWAVAISVLATSLSAATFIGGPQQSFEGDLTYFAANLGGLIAVVIVATVFIPAFYRLQVTSIYELLGHRFGGPARTAASAMFMLGRVFASGARLFIVALPFSLIAFGNADADSMITSILIIALAATVYTAAGGIRAVIWTDVLQAILLVASVTAALIVLWQKLPMDMAALLQGLRDDVAGDKLRIIDTSLDLSRPYTLPAIIIGFTLFNVAAYGTDQDLTQRMLTCRSARAGAWSVILSNLLAWPVVMLFLVLGLLLYVFHQHPDLTGLESTTTIEDTRTVFLAFILSEIPSPLRGMMIAGLMAAAMSSLDSALNAMASTTIADFYRPWRERRQRLETSFPPGPEAPVPGIPSGFTRDKDPAQDDDDGGRAPADYTRASRTAITAWAAALAAFACFCVWWQDASGDTLIDFALGVMVFAYAGLLGVFLTALLTRRGNTTSALLALLVGYLSVVAMRDPLWTHWTEPLGLDVTLAFPWQMTISTVLSFLVCIAGRRSVRAAAER